MDVRTYEWMDYYICRPIQIVYCHCHLWERPNEYITIAVQQRENIVEIAWPI